MWCRTHVANRLQIKLPIILAGMAGGVTTPQLVSAVSNAGGLGTLGAGYMTPVQLESAIRQIRCLTNRPFAVNLFVPETFHGSVLQIEQMNDLLQHYRDELRIESTPDLSKYVETFEEQLTVILDEQVPIFSFTFGILDEKWMRQLRDRQVTTIGTATTVREAVLLEQSGVDLVVAQGSEAGGHRGTFAAKEAEALVGTMALIPQIVDRINVPVIAAGGVMDGRGIVAALALGASGVQLGTAFLPCHESGAQPQHKTAVLDSTDESTVITKAFSGKPARGIKNKFVSEMEAHRASFLPYPIQNTLTRGIRQAAAKQDQEQYMSLWAGQAASLSKQRSVADFMADLVAQTESILSAFR